MTLRIVIALLAALAAAPAHAAERELMAGGRERDYRIHRPDSAPEGPLPAVIVLHGGFGSSSQAERAYGWNDMADAEGFLAVYPDGVRRAWNAGGGCCGRPFRDGVDDVRFLDAMIGALIEAGEADPERIYLTGISNGAAMAYRYACEGAYRAAAIGAVAGARTVACPDPRPVAVMAIHGLRDDRIPAEGGPGTGRVDIAWPSLGETLAPFIAANDCGAARRTVVGVVATTERPCAAGRAVTLITIADGGHMWPSGQRPGFLARTLLDLDDPSGTLVATEALWDFFLAQPRLTQAAE